MPSTVAYRRTGSTVAHPEAVYFKAAFVIDVRILLLCCGKELLVVQERNVPNCFLHLQATNATAMSMATKGFFAELEVCSSPCLYFIEKVPAGRVVCVPPASAIPWHLHAWAEQPQALKCADISAVGSCLNYIHTQDQIDRRLNSHMLQHLEWNDKVAPST